MTDGSVDEGRWAFPIARLRRVGASTNDLVRARRIWAGLAAEERRAEAERIAGMDDAELRSAIAETRRSPRDGFLGGR